MTNKNIGRARILQERKNMERDKVDYLHAEPLETDLYTWHFTFRGPENTDFHEGLYHGQIILPFQYPFKPPDIIFANKNGRFEVNTKICLTITQYHTQQWNSAWTIRTMLEAVVSLFNQRVVGHGYLQSSSDARKFFAKASHQYTCEKCGKISQIIKPRQPMSKLKESKLQPQKEEDLLPEEQKMIYSQLKKQKEERSKHETVAEQHQKNKDSNLRDLGKQKEKATGEKQMVAQRQKQPSTKQKKETVKKQGGKSLGHELFYHSLLRENEVYLKVIKSKRLIQQ